MIFASMKSVLLVVRAWALYGLLMLLFSCKMSSDFLDTDFDSQTDPSLTYKYDRINEVNKECQFVLSSASEMRLDDNRVYSTKKELSFKSGDWWQDSGEAPIMPFVDRDLLKNASDKTPINLISLWVTDIDGYRRSKKSVNVNGRLYMSMSREGMLGKKPSGESPYFHIRHGQSELCILFQGIYIEMENNGGERLMCLLGNAILPAREPDSSNPWEWVKDSGYNSNQPPLLQDDQILLVLRYPKMPSLTNMAIRGEMSNLNPKSNPKYFDKVHLSSQLGPSAKYQFSPEKILSKACSPYPYNDALVNGEIHIYKGADFCRVLRQYSGGVAFTVMPNWKCNGTDDYCSKLGPFIADKEIKATNGGFARVKLIMQNVRCVQTVSKDGASSARVSTVFRAVSPFENLYSAAHRSGLSNTTLVAEGVWKSSGGQLCMIGCLGIADAKGNGCDSRICLYIPISFSIKQRSVIIGSISSTDNQTESYFPLSFEKLVKPTELQEWFSSSHLTYRYTKLSSAGGILEKYEPFSFGSVIKKSLLKFPKLEDAEAVRVSLSLLSEDLTLHVSAVPDSAPTSEPPVTDIQLEILSLNSLFGRSKNGSVGEETPYHTKAEYTEKQILLNISAQLTLTGKQYSNFSVLFLEGLYDPHFGRMYLIGCRDVRASWKTLFESMDLEAGLDCLIEMVVSYPPTTTQWLVNPTARISISSQRNEDDPLHFSQLKLQTYPIMYRKGRKDILSREGVEGILQILTLSMAISCILTQLFYLRNNKDAVPYMSLVMLGIQVLEYSLPLITSAEALFKRRSSESHHLPYHLEINWWFHLIDYSVKLLLLVSLLSTLRLFQKVWKSRARLLARAPLEPLRVPNDKNVLSTILTIHVIGYAIVLIIHTMTTRQREKYVGVMGTFRKKLETELEGYIGLVQDFFLLPQVIGNIMWQIDCKPLRKLYFVGITVVRLLPHIYDYVRDPLPNPYFSEKHEFVNPNWDFYSKVWDVAIPVMAVFFAFAVYIQQQWSYQKLSQTLTFGPCKFLPSASRMYRRLPSKSSEAELVSSAAHEKELYDEE